jgi:hypothetical protein
VQYLSVECDFAFFDDLRKPPAELTDGLGEANLHGSLKVNEYVIVLNNDRVCRNRFHCWHARHASGFGIED